MKNFIGILLLLSFTLGLKGQVDHTNILEVSTTYVKISNSFRLESGLDYKRNINTNIWSIGVRWNMLSDVAESGQGHFKLSGVQLGYSKLISTSYSKLDLEAKVGLGYRIYSNTWAANYFASNGEYVPVNSSSLEHVILPSIGYGLKFHLFKSVYITHQIGVGYFMSKLVAGRSNVVDNVGISGSQHDFRRYGNHGLVLNAAIGLGVQF